MKYMGILICWIPHLVEAASPAQLWSWFEDLRGYEATVEQQTYNESGQLVEEQKAHVRLLKPHFFHWEQSTPEVQVIHADGLHIQQYSPDLKQNMIQVQDPKAFASSPLELWLQPVAVLKKQYVLVAHTDPWACGHLQAGWSCWAFQSMDQGSVRYVIVFNEKKSQVERWVVYMSEATLMLRLKKGIVNPRLSEEDFTWSPEAKDIEVIQTF